MIVFVYWMHEKISSAKLRTNISKMWAKRRLIVGFYKQSLKIVVSTAQILAQFGPVFNVKWPLHFNNIAEFFGNVNLNPFGEFRCSTFYKSYYARFAAPFVIPGALLLYMILSYAARSRSKSVYVRRQAGNIFTERLAFLIFLFYPSLITNIFGALQCHSIVQGVSYLRADYSISCQDSVYEIFRKFVYFLVVLIAIGCPALYGSWFLRYHRIIYEIQMDEHIKAEEAQRTKKRLEADEVESGRQGDEAERACLRMEKAERMEEDEAKQVRPPQVHPPEDDLQTFFSKLGVADYEAQMNEIFCNDVDVTSLSKDDLLFLLEEKDVENFGVRDESAKHTLTKHVKEAKVKKRFGLLFSYYKPECFWWELLSMVRKLIVVGFSNFLTPGSYMQSVIVLCVAFVFTVMASTYFPYVGCDFKTMAYNYLEVGGWCVVFVCTLCVLLLKIETDDSFLNEQTIDWILVFAYVPFTAAYFIFAAIAIRKLLGALELEEQTPTQNAAEQTYNIIVSVNDREHKEK